MNCPECGNKASRNGKTKTGIQKYICKPCSKSFNENYDLKKEAYTRTEQRLLSMLLSFLDAEPNKNLSLKQYLEESRTSSRSIRNIKLRSFEKKFNEPIQFATYGAFMLISIHGNNIELTKFVQPISSGETLSIDNGKIKIRNF